MPKPKQEKRNGEVLVSFWIAEERAGQLDQFASETGSHRGPFARAMLSRVLDALCAGVDVKAALEREIKQAAS